MLIAALWASALTMARADDDDDEGGGSGDSEQIELEGSIPAKCEFGEPPTGSIGTLVQGGVYELGLFAFTCNLATSGPVHVTVLSENGGLKREDGPDTIPYEISWAALGTSNFIDAGLLNPAAHFYPPSGPNGIAQTAPYIVKVTGSTASLPAGTYKDKVTYTISP
jgi:hypothetical protein